MQHMQTDADDPTSQRTFVWFIRVLNSNTNTTNAHKQLHP